jgi:hypothetical protein
MSYMYPPLEKKKRKPRAVPEPEKRCGFSHSNGEPCRVHRMNGFDFCYFHEPSMTEVRLENSQRGGKTRTVPLEVEAPTMESLEDVRQFTVETLHQVRTGALEPRTAAVLSSLVAHVLKTLPDVDENTQTIADQLREMLEDEDVSESTEASQAG